MARSLQTFFRNPSLSPKSSEHNNPSSYMSCFGVPAIPSAPQPAEQNPFIDAQIYSLYPVRQPSQSKNLCPIHENPQFRGRDLQNLPSVHKNPSFCGRVAQTSVSVHEIVSFCGQAYQNAPVIHENRSFCGWYSPKSFSVHETPPFHGRTSQNRLPIRETARAVSMSVRPCGSFRRECGLCSARSHCPG